jgi:hypothetical protein
MLQSFGRTEYDGRINWISPGRIESTRGLAFRTRRKFQRSEIDSAGKLNIAAECYYALYLNGVLIGTGPARGNQSCNFLDTYDVNDCIKEGENDLAIEVYCNLVPSFTSAPAEPAVFVQSGRLITDASWEVQIASDYRTEDVPCYTFQNGLMLWRDYRKTPKGWKTFEDTSAWQKARLIPDSAAIHAKKLFYRDVPMLRQSHLAPTKISGTHEVDRLADPEQTNVAEILTTEKHFPCRQDLTNLISQKETIINPPDGHDGVGFILDMGCEFIGGFKLELDAQEGTILDVGYQEIVENGRLDLTPAAYDMADRFIFTQGRQVVDNPLHYRGGRFMQLVFRNFHQPIRIHHFSVIDRRYPIDASSTFSCNSEKYNELWKRCFNTLSACSVDTFIDCPWREMSFWVNDFLIVATFWLKMIGRLDLVHRSLALAISHRRSDGLIFGVCPDGQKKNLLFATNLFLPMILKETLLHTGDRKSVDDMLSELADIVSCCEKYADTNGLLVPPSDCWNFVDWSYHFTDRLLDGKNSCVVNLFYVHALKALADLYQSVDSAKSQSYADKSRKVMKMIERHFWDSEQQCFIEWLPMANEKSVRAGKLVESLALLTDMLDPAVEARIKNDLAENNAMLPELYMMHFYFQALAKIGRHDEIGRLIRTYWSPMLETDCSTIWEANVYQSGKKAYGNAGSLCHAFALAPIACFQQYILGIEPITDGFMTFSFAPVPGELKTASGSVLCPCGKIEVKWIAKGRTIQAKITVPEKTSCRLADGRILAAGSHEIQLAGLQ